MQMISIIINSLNYEWKDAVTKINHVPIAQRTVDHVCRLLTEEEALMLATPHLRGPPASRAPAKRSFRGRTSVPRTPRCYTCNRVGHTTRDCPQRVPVPATYQPRGTDSRGRGRGGRQGRRGPRRDPQAPVVTLAVTNDPHSDPDYDRRLLWTLDSGAALHVTYRKELFTEMHEPEPELRVLYSFSNHPCKVAGKGTVYVEELDAVIPDVYYIPSASSNLLSQSHLSRTLKFQVHHLEKASYIIKNGDIVAETMLIGGVYYLKPKYDSQASMQTPNEESTGPERDAPERDPVAPVTPKAPKANRNKRKVAQSKPKVPHKIVNVANSLTGKPLHSRCIHKWHRRLGHASFRVLRKMPEVAKGLDLKGCKVFLDCAVCKKAKSKATAIPKHATRLSTRIFDLVHTDIVGPFAPTLGGKKYFLTIVDNYSRYGYVYPMREKSETFQIFKDFAALVHTQHNVRIARIQSDRGAEFMSQQFQNWMRKNGILHQTSAPYTPAHNGVVERRQGVLQTMMRCLLEDANLSLPYWGEAIKYANYIVNRTWSSVIDQTPFYMLYGYKPDLRNLHIFGSYAMVNIPLAQRRKGGPAAKRLRFMGIDDNSKWSKFIDSTHTMVISQSANFEEDVDWSRIHSNDPGVYFPRDETADATQTDEQADVPTTGSSPPDVPSPQAADVDASDDGEDEDETEEEWAVVPRRSKRVTKGIPPKRYAWQLTKAPLPLICSVTLPPDNFTQIKHLPDSEQDKWYEAMQAEMDSLKKLKVFTPAKPPTNKKVIGTRWVYRIKKKPNGESLYKARLVAQGFAQRYPEDYTNTYSPTVRNESIRIALSTATILGLEAFQFDVETAYLHADLDEEIYVKAPPGFRKQEGDTWFLQKSLYGLKQSGLMWYLCLSDKLNSMGFIKSETDECVFTKRSNNAYEIVLVYVDDIVYIGPNKKMSENFAKALQKHFTLKFLGHINTYLGVHIDKTKKGFSLSQEDKIEQLLHHCNMKDANTTKTPMQTDFHNVTHEPSPEFEDQTLYRSVIGSLLYISSWTRPDIALSVNLLSRHVGKATHFHWTCVKKLLRYLKHTKHRKLVLEPTHTDYAELCCYADSDWASDKKSRKSTSGYMMFLNGCPVYWQVRKQNFVSCSSTEAEYACVSDACNSLTWFDALITDIWTHPIRPITVMEDNESVVYISESRFTGSRSRHIDIRYHNIKQLVKQGFVKLQYVPTQEQIADILNKPLPAAQHEYLCKKMCLI